MSKDIVCVLTPPGLSAVAVIGLRGPTVWQKLAPFFQSSRPPQLNRQARVHRGRLGDGDIGDDVVLSLQGDETEQIIEVQAHGGPGIVQWLLDFVQRMQCQPVSWDEWLRGSLDSLWSLLPLAITRKTSSILLDQCQGAFIRALEQIQHDISRQGADRRQLLENVKRLRQWESLGAHLIHPWRVVLAGPPNVGKSSLFNALLGFDRAITSPHPGTTRDLVEATLVWKGFPIILIDTAGMREATDSLEAAGIARATEASADADMVLWLIDLSQDQSVLPDQVRPTFVIGTKGDLPRLAQIAVNYTVSSATNTGLNDLLDGILAYFLPILPEPGQGIPVSDQDRKRLLELEEQLRIAPASACEPPPAR